MGIWKGQTRKCHSEAAEIMEGGEKAQIIPIYKKGSRLECSNYRGISLLSVVGKVYARVLNDRVKLMTADKVMDEQGNSGQEGGLMIQFLQSGRLWRRPSKMRDQCA